MCSTEGWENGATMGRKPAALTADAGDRATARVAARVHTAVTSNGLRPLMNGMLPDSSRMLRGRWRRTSSQSSGLLCALLPLLL